MGMPSNGSVFVPPLRSPWWTPRALPSRRGIGREYPLLKRLDGTLGLTGVVKYLLYKNEIRGTRALLFGIKPEFRQMGLPLVLLDYVLELQNKKPQYHYLEAGWTLEDNDAINLLLEDFGGRQNKRSRIYRQDL
jgi:hypothetical protein